MRAAPLAVLLGRRRGASLPLWFSRRLSHASVLPQTDGGYLGPDIHTFVSAVFSGAAGTYVFMLDRDAGISTPLTVSIIGCVVNGPGEARETDIGLTGGGRGTHQVYLSGIADHRIHDENLVDHIVALVEKKVAEIEAAEAEQDGAETRLAS